MDKLQRIDRICRQFYCGSRYLKNTQTSVRYFATEKDDGIEKLNELKSNSENSNASSPHDTVSAKSQELPSDRKDHDKYSAAEIELEKEIEKELNATREERKPKLGGFAQSYKKHLEALEPKDVTQEAKFYTFAKLLRESKFIDLGNPEGKIVSGKIFQTVGDDLYIDFGWKFYCVCPRPARNGKHYVRGSTVRLRIKDLELSTRFIGSTTDLTLSEADCTLLGLLSSPTKQTEDVKSTK